MMYLNSEEIALSVLPPNLEPKHMMYLNLTMKLITFKKILT